MRRLLPLIFLICCGNTNDLPIPPQYQGSAAVLVHMVSNQKDLDTFCGGPASVGIKLGCETGPGRAELVTGNPCLYPEVKDVHSYAHLMCHEKAHVLGWRHKAPF